jgi:hypothetical protein
MYSSKRNITAQTAVAIVKNTNKVMAFPVIYFLNKKARNNKTDEPWMITPF